MVAFLAGEAVLSAFLRASIFFTTLSWAINAFFFSGNLVLASCFLISAILALRALDFLPETTFVIFLTLAAIFANLALAALSYFLMTAFFAGGAAASYFLIAATFFWALSWATNNFFLLGSVAAAIYALIKATFLASILACFLNTTFVDLTNSALASFSFVFIAFFSSGVATFNHPLTSATFCAASSWASNAFLN